MKRATPHRRRILILILILSDGKDNPKCFLVYVSAADNTDEPGEGTHSLAGPSSISFPLAASDILDAVHDTSSGNT